ncbi:DJ-1/PfpI family protein, partial [Micrococcus luteus]|uniref:DJ-1/PfpI family protein n=1 Tax=Micrococcus luteus TaxID=1270 RepID=UPI0033FD8B38
MSNYTRMGWGCLLVLWCVCWRVSGAGVVWVMAWSMAGVLAVAVPAPPAPRAPRPAPPAPPAPRPAPPAPRPAPRAAPRAARAAPRAARAAPRAAPRAARAPCCRLPCARFVGPCRGLGAVWACAGRSRGGWGLVSDRGCVRAGGRVGAAGGGGLVRPGRRWGTVSAGPGPAPVPGPAVCQAPGGASVPAVLSCTPGTEPEGHPAGARSAPRPRASGAVGPAGQFEAGKTVTGKQKEAEVKIDKSIDDVTPDEFDALFIPGGFSPDQLRGDDRAVAFAKSFMDS